MVGGLRVLLDVVLLGVAHLMWVVEGGRAVHVVGPAVLVVEVVVVGTVDPLGGDDITGIADLAVGRGRLR